MEETDAFKYSINTLDFKCQIILVYSIYCM